MVITSNQSPKPVIHIARQAKVNVGDISGDAQVELSINEENLPTLGVALDADLPGVDQDQEIEEKACRQGVKANSGHV